MSDVTSARRRRNRRGEGELLRADIVAAARTLLEEHGTEAAVTLRGVAREVGITAPAIYPHFPDVESLIHAVIASAHADLRGTFDRARTALGENPHPLDLLRARGQAYIEFGHRRPASYQILYSRPRPSPVPAVGTTATAGHQEVVDAIAAAAPHLSEAEAADVGIVFWTALHGLATLPPHHPRFPWPDLDEIFERLLATQLGQDVVDAHPPKSTGAPGRRLNPTP